MKIEKTTAVADHVLTPLLRRLRKSKFDGDAIVYPYVNGRERGWRVDICSSMFPGLWTASVAFSENRNSDDIVVYPENAHELTQRPEVGITDIAYAKKAFFHSGHFSDAAAFAYRNLMRQVVNFVVSKKKEKSA